MASHARRFSASASPVGLRFGQFEYHPQRHELKKFGVRVRIQRQPLAILLMLLESPGSLITREQLRSRLWDSATFVAFEHGLNSAVKRLRDVLCDSADQPRYIETVPGEGYRFIASVERLGPVLAPSVEAIQPAIPTAPSAELDHHAKLEEIINKALGNDRNLRYQHESDMRSDHQRAKRDTESARLPAATAAMSEPVVRWNLIILAALTLGLLAAVGYFYLHRTPKLTGKDTIVLADFSNTTGDPVFDGALRQGLAIQLEQSPFLSIISDQQIQQTLGFMGEQVDARLIGATAREVCQRTGSKAYIQGSISDLGKDFVIGLDAVNCVTGDSLGREQVEVDGKEKVLGALGRAATILREKLGESLTTVQNYDTPIELATTSSLEALKAKSAASIAYFKSGPAAAIPFQKRAIELDPNFALGYAELGRAYAEVGESKTAAAYTRKAYELRDRTSEWEKYWISTSYELVVTGNLLKAEQICELWTQAYPRSWEPHAFLSGIIQSILGQYEKAVSEAITAISLNQDNSLSYAILMSNYVSVNRLAEAKATYDQAVERKLDFVEFHSSLYGIAFLQGDATGMAKQVTWASGKPGVEDLFLAAEADTAAYSGQLKKARQYSREAIDSALRSDEAETSGTYAALSIVRESLFGNLKEALNCVTPGMERSSAREMQYGAALALAFAGDNKRAQELVDDLNKTFPNDTLVQFNYLPTLHAQLALNHHDSKKAIEILQKAMPYEMGSPAAPLALYPLFVRGQAYLALRRGNEAAIEFQKILDHRGIVQNAPIGALAHLQLGRANAMQGDTAKAKTAYQDFLTLWKDSDPDIPILKQAKAEYAKLQ